MRNVLVTLVILLSVQMTYAQDFSFGLQASGILGWMKPEAKGVSSTGLQIGYNYGLMLDYNIAENYAFATGLQVTQAGGKLKHDSAIVFLGLPYTGNPEISYRIQYVELPLTLKLKTNEIGYITYFGQFGFTPGINIGAKGSLSTNTTAGLVDENIIKEVKFLNLGLTIGAGLHYNLGGNTDLVSGLYFNNGFLDVTDDVEERKAILNYLALRVAVMF